ncbi:hypothetical protein KC336_g23268 [Hortaea werneckii]|nr:hypothetical protein KC336_g23268 [Hortaea werneckii]
MVFTGYTYSADAKDEVPSYSQNATIPACPTLNSGNASCQLQRVDFPTAFRGMSGLRMQAFSGNEERMFFLDDLALGWASNTCEAANDRVGTMKGGPGDPAGAHPVHMESEQTG